MPVSPPMPNIGRNAVAHNIGTLNRIDPPQSEMKNALRMMTEGIEIRSVVVWKNALTVEPIPVSHIWCAQTMKDKKPITSTEKTSDLKRHDKITERGERDGDDTQEDHDGAVHRAQRVIKLRRHFAVGHGIGPEEIRQPLPNYRQRLPGVRQLPAHDHHQTKTEKQKD